MSSEDKEWLITVFPTLKNKTLRGVILEDYYRAEMLLDGADTIKKRGCSCQYRSLKINTESKYEKWLKEN